ncbi:MAG: membrane-bound lytic murein transglycosylase MltF [Lysobacterales bacterium]|jgi:membrane-bound lytic murein transglycosylase MltF
MACSQDSTENSSAASPSVPSEAAPKAEIEQSPEISVNKGPGTFLLSSSEQGLPPELAPLSQAWSGDFDGMVERRVIRVLTVFQLGGYFLDGPQEKGLTYDFAKLFEKFLNERLHTGHVKFHVVLIPVQFDQLLDALRQGYGDIAAAGLTITAERDELVDFSAPLARDVNEVIITGPSSPTINSIDDLAGKQVYAKPGSSYIQSLTELNLDFSERGMEQIEILDTPASLEDVELLEMVAAGLFPIIVMDDYKARFWAEIFETLQVRDDLAIKSGQQIAWAFREDSPLLTSEINEFIRINGKGTLMGNILIKRYLKNTKWAKNALDPDSLDKFEQTIAMFEQYSGEYGFDHLMIAAQGYQESRLDQSVRSNAGAIGIMQVLPSTATDKNVNIPEIEIAEHNIHAGIKYLNFVRNRYFDDPELDDFNAALFSFAAYNAGPARVRSLRKKAEESGLDRNIWFNNVELIAAKEIGRETVQYVSNIYKYYIAYRLISDKQQQRDASQKES